MSQVFVSQTLLALGSWFVPILLAILAGLIWFALWLLGKGGWRAWLGWAIVAAIMVQVAPLVLS